jgi:hypothetical protein
MKSRRCTQPSTSITHPSGAARVCLVLPSTPRSTIAFDLTFPSARAHDELATLVNVPCERLIMKLTFLGKDSTPNDSPTLYETDRATYLVQGYVVTDPEAPLLS